MIAFLALCAMVRPFGADKCARPDDDDGAEEANGVHDKCDRLAAKEEVCGGRVRLRSLFERRLGEGSIFFVETSERDVLTTREACALESAVRSGCFSTGNIDEVKIAILKLKNSVCLPSLAQGWPWMAMLFS